MKSVLFITREIVPFHYGGIGTQFKAAAKLYRRLDHRVAFLTQRHGNFDDTVFRNNYGDARVFFTDTQGLEDAPDVAVAYAFRTAERFRELQDEIRPDLVFLADYGAEGAVLLLQVRRGLYPETRFVLIIEGMLRDTLAVFEGQDRDAAWSTLQQRPIQVACALEDLSVLLAPEIVSPSVVTWREIRRRLGIRLSAAIIPNLIDRDLFHVSNEGGDPPDTPPMVLFVGRLDRHKGADLLVRAYARLAPGFKGGMPRLVMIGRDAVWREFGGTFTQWAKEQLPEAFLETVRFPGQVPHAEVAAYMRRATVCVFPSRWEVFGIVCLEAMSMGCPVVVSKGTGLEEILGPELSAYAVDVSVDETPLTRALTGILNDPGHHASNTKRFRKRALDVMHTAEQRYADLVTGHRLRSEPLTIAYVCREFGPVTGGGIGTYIYHVCGSMAGLGHRVILVTDCFTEDNRHLLPEGVELVPPVPVRDARAGAFTTPSHEYTYRVLDTLREVSGKVQLDVVEFAEYGFEGFAAIRAKRLMGEFPRTRLIVKLHTPKSLIFQINEDCRTSASLTCEIAMEDYGVRHADLVTSPSTSLADYFLKRTGRRDIRICPYPMKLPVLESPRRFGREQTRTVRFVGTIQVRKGVDVFIDAAAKVLDTDPDFRFDIHGALHNAEILGKTYTEILQRRIPERYAEKIRFRGKTAYAEIPDLLLHSCFCVFPSRWENWANVCLEAMSMGCIVIASNQGGMAEMIEDGKSGFLVDPKDAEGIARIIRDHCDDRNFLEAMSASAHSRSRQICDPEATSRKILDNYLFALRLPSGKWQSAATDPPKVSVVIPYFNQPDYLSEAVASVRASTYDNVEIVVVNDGSTSRKANAVFEDLERVVKVRKPNGGLSSARNAGIRASSGAFVLPLDADDRIHPDYIRLGVEALLNNPDIGYVSCHAMNFGVVDTPYIPVGFVPELMLAMNTDGKCANLFRRSVFETCGGYDETMPSYEDWDFLITLHENGLEGDVLPEELFQYRRHFDSMVYTTANHHRAELIQYMMIKHPKLLGQSSAMLALVLADQWKKQEVQYEMLFQNRFQVYFIQNGLASESNSIRVHHPVARWCDLSVRIPIGLPEGVLRVDPSGRPGTITIKRITVIEEASDETVFSADASSRFSGCTPLANTRCDVADDRMVVEALDHDPQLLLQTPPVAAAAVLRVSLRYDHPVYEVLGPEAARGAA